MASASPPCAVEVDARDLTCMEEANVRDVDVAHDPHGIFEAVRDECLGAGGGVHAGDAADGRRRFAVAAILGDAQIRRRGRAREGSDGEPQLHEIGRRRGSSR